MATHQNDPLRPLTPSERRRLEHISCSRTDWVSEEECCGSATLRGDMDLDLRRVRGPEMDREGPGGYVTGSISGEAPGHGSLLAVAHLFSGSDFAAEGIPIRDTPTKSG